MKIRLAKKIMKQSEAFDHGILAIRDILKYSTYWLLKWNRYYDSYPSFCKADHRIIKAISLTSKISTIADKSKKKKYENTK